MKEIENAYDKHNDSQGDQVTMKTITYAVVDSLGVRTPFDAESEARAFARRYADVAGQCAYVLEIETRFLTAFAPEQAALPLTEAQ